MNEPCQLWPNHPIPEWLRSPFVIFLLFLIGALFGFSAGAFYTHWWHYKIKTWLHRGGQS
jgi:hypothetical protein